MSLEAKNYYVVGVNGTGKSTIVRRTCEFDHRLVQVRTTHELTTWLGFPDDYDKLRAMDQNEVLQQYGVWVHQYMENRDLNKSYIFESHILNLIKGKVTDRTGDWIKRFDALVLVESPVETILDRIELDTEKDRAMFPDGFTEDQKLRMLGNFCDQTRTAFEALVVNLNKDSLIINNSGDIGLSVRNFLEFCRN